MHFIYYVLLIPCLFLLCRHTHELKLHQLLVRVCGWEQIKPVSVDKVGVFFRYAAADRTNSSNTVSTSKNYENKTNFYDPDSKEVDKLCKTQSSYKKLLFFVDSGICFDNNEI